MWGWGNPLESNKSAGVVERNGLTSDSGCGAVRVEPFRFWSLRDIRFIPGWTAVAPDYRSAFAYCRVDKRLTKR